MIFNTFNVICKKNNQIYFPDSDREIPSLGSTDNAGNSVKCRKLGKPRFRQYPFTLGLGFLCLHRRPMIDSIYQ